MGMQGLESGRDPDGGLGVPMSDTVGDAFNISGTFARLDRRQSNTSFRSGSLTIAVSAMATPAEPYEPELFKDLWSWGAVKAEDPMDGGAEDGYIASIAKDKFGAERLRTR